MYQRLSLAAASFVFAGVMLLPMGTPATALAANCLYGEWQLVSYRDSVQAVLGPGYSVQDVTANAHVSLRSDHTFTVVADGQIAATRASHQVTLRFSGQESGGFREEVPGQFRITEGVVEANASDVTVDGMHLPGPVDVSDLFMWTPPSVAGGSPTTLGHFVLPSGPDAAPTLEFTYTCDDADHLALQQFHASIDAPSITYQRVGPDAAGAPDGGS